MSAHSISNETYNKPLPFVINKKDDKEKIRKNWLTWKKEFENYIRLSGGYTKLSEEGRALLLQNLMGRTAIETMENMDFNSEEEKSDMDILLMKFDEIFNPPLNECVSRFDFFSSKIDKNQTYDDFLQLLKTKAKTCNFGENEDKFIVDVIIVNVDDLLRKMIFDYDVTCSEDILAICRYNAFNEKKIREMITSHEDSTSEDDDKTSIHSQPTGKYIFKKPCWRCKTIHDFNKCPAKHNICSVCQISGHLSGNCQQDRRKRRDNHLRERERREKIKPQTSEKTVSPEKVERCKFGINCTRLGCKLAHYTYDESKKNLNPGTRNYTPLSNRDDPTNINSNPLRSVFDHKPTSSIPKSAQFTAGYNEKNEAFIRQNFSNSPKTATSSKDDNSEAFEFVNSEATSFNSQYGRYTSSTSQKNSERIPQSSNNSQGTAYNGTNIHNDPTRSRFNSERSAPSTSQNDQATGGYNYRKSENPGFSRNNTKPNKNQKSDCIIS